MSSLRELQESCYRAFLLDESADLLPAVRGDGVPAAERVRVYQNNARETFRKTLLASFPVVERLVGADCFSGLSLKYMREHPSRSGDLQSFAARFPAFLSGIYAPTPFAYLGDVARLEWALEEVHLEPDEPVLAPADLSAVAGEDRPALRLRVRRCVRLLRSRYPVLSIWRANQPGNDPSVDLAQGPEAVAVLRRGDDLQMHRLDTGAFTLASAFATGATLEEACDALATDDGDQPELVSALQSVVLLGLIAAFSPTTPRDASV